jgi:malyl-CoA/(S)-citramalyl-CoA lyase
MARQINITRHNTQKRIDLIMIPKVGTAADVYAIDMMVTQIKTAKGFKKRISFEHIIETALGM